MLKMEYKWILLSVIFSALWIATCGQDITYHIDEELRNSSFIGNVVDDSNLLSAIGGSDSTSLTFTVITGGEYSHLFRVDETKGDFYTNAVIDREEQCEFSETCMLTLQIVAKSTLGSFFHVLKIHVFINDLNDHSPEFPNRSISITISESVLVGTSYSIPGARDKDTSPGYSLKEYKLSSGVNNEPLPFSIQFTKHLDGSSSVRLFVTETLDREIKDSYNFEIVATDADVPPRQGKLFMSIKVSDINDNQPQFESSSYNCTVTEETAQGAVIINLNATDADAAENGLVKYSFSTHQAAEIFEHFEIEENTGKILLKKQVVFTPGKKYSIIVEAYDNPLDRQSLSTQALVQVNVENSGNNAPVILINILSSTNTAEIPENANIGTVVAYVVVQDHDIGRQGMASCIIQSIDFDIQRIDMNRYKIYVNQKLDFERTPTQNVTVHCQDNGVPPLPASASFLVKITDVNDHSPFFVADTFSANVREDTPVGESIIEVSATDADSGDNALVDFEVSSEFSDYFYFDTSSSNRPNTATLTLGKKLDRETTATYVFAIFAKDRGSSHRVGNATAKIYVTDVNDQSAVFTKSPFEFFVLENLYTDSDVGDVTATDADLGVNQQLIYSMHPDFVGKVPFAVVSDGKIKTTRELDREVTNRYDFKVIAVDRGENPLSSTGTVIVRVSDANDMRPVISFPKLGNNTVFVSQTSAAWQVVSKVIARDDDEEGTSNSRLRYSIEGRNDSQLFQISPTSGEIQLTHSLNPSEVGKIYRLEFFVSDYGKTTERKSAEAVMYVKIVSHNATDAAASTDVLSNKNFMIAIIVAVVTVVLSIGIVASICIIRKIDRERKDDSRRKSNHQVIDPDINAKQVFDGSITVFSLPSEDSLLEKKKKEVSFSLEDDVFSDDDLLQKNGINGNHGHFKVSKCSGYFKLLPHDKKRHL